MKIGIIGLETSGKTTIFNVLTGQSVEVGYRSSKKNNIGIIKVPDGRVDFLTNIYNPKKTTYAEISFIDIARETHDGHKEKGFSPKLIADLKLMDAFAVVIRTFKNDNIPHPNNNINPLSDLTEVELEMIFSDLGIIEKRLEKATKDKKLMKDKKAYEFEINLLNKCKEQLIQEKMLEDLELSDKEQKAISPYQFLTRKKYIVLLNTGESTKDTVNTAEVIKYMKEKEIIYVDLCGEIEMEITQLSESEQNEYMCELGIKEPARARFIKESYRMLDLISFLTVGKDECRAWTIKNGTKAQKAAGKIHSDLEKGFIRAETVSFNAFKEVGSIQKAKEKGLLRQEGKQYLVKDGDIINIKFNL